MISRTSSAVFTGQSGDDEFQSLKKYLSQNDNIFIKYMQVRVMHRKKLNVASNCK